MNSKALFIDTNILLHYRYLDEIDWLEILKVEQIEIFLPSIVIQELDKHKYNSSSKLRNKASRVIKKLHRLADSGLKVNLKPNIDICFLINDVNPSFEKLELDPNSQDDKLLASMLLFKDKNPDLSTVLIAADLGLRLKAKYYKLEAICLPDELKLPSELDETEKRIKELEYEVLEVQRRIPELKLCFSDKSDIKKYKIRKSLINNINLDGTIESRVNCIKQQYSKRLETQANNSSNTAYRMDLSQMYGSDIPEILPLDIAKYNKCLDEFYENYQRYLERYRHWHDICSRSFVIKILILNSGTSPAEDIDVFIHFPDGFVLSKSSEFLSEPEKPQPPSPPVPITRADRTRLVFSSLTPQIIPSSNSQNRTQANISSVDIRRSNSYDVKLHVRKIKQNTQEAFEPMIVTFDSISQVSSFQIDYQLTAANVPKPVIEKLHVIFEDEIKD